MPTPDGPTLSERSTQMSIPEQIIEYLGLVASEEERADGECAVEMERWIAWLREAARLLAPFEQPEVEAEKDFARRLREAADGWPCCGWMKAAADRVDDYARNLVELAEAREKLAAIEGLGERWRQGITSRGCAIDASRLIERADELDAALSGVGGESEGPDESP